MSGLAGNIFHLFEDPSLTFQEIKKLILETVEGNLIGTEKTDGINLYLSFSIPKKKAVFARNKKHLAEGGIDSFSLSENFNNKPDLQEALKQAALTFESFVKNLSLEEQINIFGPNANHYFNADIQDPHIPNVINYNTRSVVIHRTGHKEYDKYNNTITERNLVKEFSILEKNVDKFHNEDKLIKISKLRKLGPIDQKTGKRLLLSLNECMNAAGVGDYEPIAQFIINRIDNKIDSTMPELPNTTRKLLIMRIMNNSMDGTKQIFNPEENTTFKNIAKTVPWNLTEKYLPIINSMVDNNKDVLREAINPLKKVIQEFSNSCLKNFDSDSVSDSKSEIIRLQKEIERTKNAILNSQNEAAIKIFNENYSQFKLDEISAVEGFVFENKGTLYKLTGCFGPINQILGLAKFGRGKEIPPIHIQENKKTAVISWGRFNPPTLGHELVFKMASDLAESLNGDFYIIPTKKTDNLTNPLNFEEKTTLLSKMYPEYKNNILKEDKVRTIIEAAKYLASNGYGKLKLIVGSDRVEEFSMLNKYNGSEYVFENIEILSAGERLTEGESAAAMSASKLREAAVNGDIDSFMKGVAGRLSVEDAYFVINTIRSRITDKKKVLQPLTPSLLNEYIRKSGKKWCVIGHKKTKTGKKRKFGCYTSKAAAHKRLGQIEYFKTHENKELNEFSAGSGGGVSGFAGPFDKLEQEGSNVYYTSPESRYGRSGASLSGKRDDLDEIEHLERLYKLYEDDFMKDGVIERMQFIEELKLRKIIREAIHKKATEKKKKMLSEEQQLRSIIKKLIKEADEEDIPHESTGINVLEELLGKIIKIIKKDFKRMTTDASQRLSFRAHLINAVINTLSTEKSSDDADAEEQEKKIEEFQKANNNVTDPRFIKVDTGDTEPALPEPEDKFTIPGQDFTGRNMALKTLKKIEKQILESYQMLDNKKDKDMFYEYLIVNLKLYFDKFESEMNPSTTEPDSSTYEKEKLKGNETAASSPPEQTGNTSPEPSKLDTKLTA